jgi:hypothetical protein
MGSKGLTSFAELKDQPVLGIKGIDQFCRLEGSTSFLESKGFTSFAQLK